MQTSRGKHIHNKKASTTQVQNTSHNNDKHATCKQAGGNHQRNIIETLPTQVQNNNHSKDTHKQKHANKQGNIGVMKTPL